MSKRDSLWAVFKPTGIRVGTDAVSLIKTFSGSNFKGWEANGDVDFRNYYLAVEVGHWERDVAISNGDYNNSGIYWRAGIDVNLIKKDINKNMFFIGFRFAQSTYDEYLTFTDSTANFGVINKSIENKSIKASWGELTTGLKVKIIGGFWMGYTGRMKIFPSLDDAHTLQTYDVPGYGLTFKKPWWGFSYYLMYRIPISRKK